ncbi:peptide ABC transporter [Chromatiales bacterium (ex Bugula neritina AB1)]|nr:peptide ABC transporter [Chromatiales bacterium (ex Bugula neritina AB1)]
MWSYLFRRILAVIPVLLVVLVIVFLMLRLTPGDPAANIAGDAATTEDIAELRVELGLEEPLLVQFGIYAKNLMQGDFGESFYYKRPVINMIADGVEPTLSLALFTIVIASLIAVPLGTLAAYKQGSFIDRMVMGFSVVGFSVPVFVIGYLLIYFLSVKLEWFPVQGYQHLEQGIGGWAYRLILPATALSVIFIALIARMTRTSVLEVLNEDYIRTARAKGLAERKVVMKHALRNAAVPIVTIIGIAIGILISGVVVTESVFVIPGLGLLTLDAIQGRDYPTVQALIILFSVVYVVINLVIDLLYTLLDPRIRY